jgi:mycothiol maleylpyruvate isomerase-like protein
MQTTTSYLDRVVPAIDLVADRFVTMVTGAPDPTVRVPSTPAWTVRDVAAHLATVTVRCADGPEGRGVWTRTPMDLP